MEAATQGGGLVVAGTVAEPVAAVVGPAGVAPVAAVVGPAGVAPEAAAVGPEEVAAAAQAAVAELVSVMRPSAVVGSRVQWAEVVGSLQQVVDVAVAVQDAAIVRLAAIEPEYLEDGTQVETHKALGHVALDAPSILSGVLSSSARFAERRVEGAVLLAADGPEGTGSDSGLGGLHDAMGVGRLDPYRACVIVEELTAAPAEVRATVIAVLEPYLEVEDGAHLRRRCRRALARISPDLLRQRALKARKECGLRRWVAEPGVDRWEGTFPSEDAATAWAAVDALAQRYVRDGVCTHIEAARGRALTDLVAGQARIDTVLTVTVPATALTSAASVQPAADEPRAGAPATPGSDTGAAGTTTGAPGGGIGAPDAGGDDLVEVTGPAGNQPVFVSRAWVTAMATPNARPRSKANSRDGSGGGGSSRSGSSDGSGSPGSRSQVVQVAPCHPDTGALVDPAPQPCATAPPDVDSWSAPTANTKGDRAGTRTGETAPDTHPAEATPSTDSHRAGTQTSATAPGTHPGDTTTSIDGDGVGTQASATAPSGHSEDASTARGTPGSTAAGAYRPSAQVAARVKARDRRCRFPGCTVAAVFCDLDHVRPWPLGPTADTNLICLCRRHHRVKQRPGWRVHLAPDGTVTWTDPTGRSRSTMPADALTCTVLGGAATPPPQPTSTSRAMTVLPDGPHSHLEFRLEHHVAILHTPCRAPTTWRDQHGRAHRTELQPAIGTVLVRDTEHWHPHRRHPPRSARPSATHADDPPPF